MKVINFCRNLLLRQLWTNISGYASDKKIATQKLIQYQSWIPQLLNIDREYELSLVFQEYDLKMIWISSYSCLNTRILCLDCCWKILEFLSFQICQVALLRTNLAKKACLLNLTWSHCTLQSMNQLLDPNSTSTYIRIKYKKSMEKRKIDGLLIHL